MCFILRFEMCQGMLRDKFSSVEDNSLVLAVMMMMTSHDVHDCLSVMNLVLHDVDPNTKINFTEIVYLLLSNLTIFRTQYHFPYKILYNILHALNFSDQGPVSSKVRELTPEQCRIVNMNMRSLIGTSDTVKINAYAGTGKTTTLVELCNNNPSIRFLLVVFNKSVQEHSVKVFPRNVTVKTANSISYKYIMETEDKTSFNNWNLKYTDLINNNLIRSGESASWKPFNLYQWAALIMETLNSYCNSGDKTIAEDHVPNRWDVVRKNGKEQVALEPENTRQLVLDAKHVWNTILTKKMARIKFDHTTSMKKFQLSNPDLQRWVGQHDVLLLDEAQDMNPCMLEICLKQKVPKIVVGDSFQQIYSFRGAVDALKKVENSNLTTVRHTFYLTKSFRFGPEIAFAAQCSLKFLLHNEGPPMFGSNKRDSILGIKPNNNIEKTAILARTNLRLFTEMVKLVCSKEEHLRPKIAFPSDPTTNDSMGWEKLEQFYLFSAGRVHEIQGKAKYNPSFKKPWHQFKTQTEAANDFEQLSKILIVEQYKEKILDYVRILKEQTAGSMTDPEVKYVFSTVHKFKGLEMDHVILLDDFKFRDIPYNKFSKRSLAVEEDEINLLYVALTRAKKILTINPALFYLLTGVSVDDCMEQLVKAPERSYDCMRCLQSGPSESSVVIQQSEVNICDRMKRVRSFLCTKCSVMSHRRVHDTISHMNSHNQIEPGYICDLTHLLFRCLVYPGQDTFNREQLEAHENFVLTGLDHDHEVESVVHAEQHVEAEVDDWGDDGEDEVLLLVAEVQGDN